MCAYKILTFQDTELKINHGRKYAARICLGDLQELSWKDNVPQDIPQQFFNTYPLQKKNKKIKK